MGYRAIAASLWLAACSFRQGAAGADGGSSDGNNRGGGDATTAERIQLAIDNTTRAETFTDFPLLVTLDPSRIDYSAVAPGGSDLRFYAADGTTLLPYEIDTWAPTDHSYIWVGVPSVAASTTTVIWLDYGERNAPATPAATGVWASEFVGVWHLSQAPGPAGAIILDSTARANDATPTANLTSSALVPGQIGPALQFAGTTENVAVASAFTLSTYSWSLWLWAPAAPVTGNGNTDVISDGDQNFNFCWDHNELAFTAAAAQDSAIWTSAAITAALSGQHWYHIASTYDGTNLCVYLDGAQQQCNTATTPNAPDGSFAIGGAHVGTDSNTFPGIVDEVHLVDQPWSMLRLAAEYASESDQMITYGSASPAP